MTQNKIVEIGANVVNSKKNEGGGGSRLKNMEQGKEWSTDTQNKLRDDLAEDIKNEVQKKTLNLKNKIPFREVKRGDTLLAVIAGMKRGGALENVKNINNLKVKIGEKEFANMFVDDL